MRMALQVSAMAVCRQVRYISRTSPSMDLKMVALFFIEASFDQVSH